MSQHSTAIMSKLAWRAKWRRRWSEWRNRIVLMVLLFMVAMVALIFTPWLPNKVFKSAVKTKLDPVTGELRADSIKRVYDLGMFYELTMRKKEAMECYKEMLRWYFGFDIHLDFNEMDEGDLEKLDFPPGTEKYAANALENSYKHFRMKRSELYARYLANLYIETFADEPWCDATVVMNMERFVQRR